MDAEMQTAYLALDLTERGWKPEKAVDASAEKRKAEFNTTRRQKADEFWAAMDAKQKAAPTDG